MTIILNNARWRICTIIAAGMWLSAVPLLSYGLEMSVPAGVQEIGKRLQMKSTLSGIPEGAESQLRSTCMRSRIQSIDTATDGDAIDVWVSFQPTIRQGGLVEFESAAPVNHALVQLELVSECPLVTFTSRWTLIMNQGQPGAASAVEPDRRGIANNKFDLANSSILAASRRTPTRTVNFMPAYEQPDLKPEVVEKKIVEPAAPSAPEVETPAKVIEEPIRIASLDTNLIGNGLIESRRAAGSSHGGLGMDDPEMGLIETFGLNHSLLTAMAAGLLLLTFLLYLSRKYKLFGAGFIRKIRLSEPVKHQEPQLSEFRQGAGVDSNLNKSGSVVSDDPAVFGRDRFLESLIASDDDASFQDDMLSPLHLDDVESQDASNRSSLKISLELINRADSRKWNLPEAYQGLVEQRNRSLEQSKMTEALILRSQIGLVELAFQDAKQGRSTQSQTALDLLMLVLGEHVYDVEAYPSLGVPDVVKSHVRAKMCEIAGADLRQLLRENLVHLNVHISSPALCFHSDAWREFLSEEGMLN